MSFRNICREIRKNLPHSTELSTTIRDGCHHEFHSIEELNPLLNNYGPIMRVNLENISSGESSPCHSDYEKPPVEFKRKKDLTLYNIMSNYLESTTVEELNFHHQQNTGDFDWVIIMGFLNDQQVSQAKELLSNTSCKSKVRYAKRVFYKGFRSCLFECKSTEEARFVLDFVLTDPSITKEIRANLWGFQLRSKFKDPDFEISYNAVIIKNIPSQFTPETFRQVLNATCSDIQLKSIDVLTLIENTIVTVVNFHSLEEAELICQKLNNKEVQKSYILKAALIFKPEFKHRNKEHSIFKEYLIEPQKIMLEKMMLQKIINSKLFKLQENSEAENAPKKNNVKDILNLLNKKPSASNPNLSTEIASTDPSMLSSSAVTQSKDKETLSQVQIPNQPELANMSSQYQMFHHYPHLLHHSTQMTINEQTSNQQQPSLNPVMPYFMPQGALWPSRVHNCFPTQQKVPQTKSKGNRNPSVESKNPHGDQLEYSGFSMQNYPYYGPVMMPGGYYYGPYPPNPYASFPIEHCYGPGFIPQVPQNPVFHSSLTDTATTQSSNKSSIKSVVSDKECIQKKVFAENNKTFVASKKIIASTTKESSLPKRSG